MSKNDETINGKNIIPKYPLTPSSASSTYEKGFPAGNMTRYLDNHGKRWAYNGEKVEV